MRKAPWLGGSPPVWVNRAEIAGDPRILFAARFWDGSLAALRSEAMGQVEAGRERLVCPDPIERGVEQGLLVQVPR